MIMLTSLIFVLFMLQHPFVFVMVIVSMLSFIHYHILTFFQLEVSIYIIAQIPPTLLLPILRTLNISYPPSCPHFYMCIYINIYITIIYFPQLGSVKHTFNPSVQKADRRISSGQTGLHHEFQSSHRNTVRPYLKPSESKYVLLIWSQFAAVLEPHFLRFEAALCKNWRILFLSFLGLGQTTVELLYSDYMLITLLCSNPGPGVFMIWYYFCH